MAKKKDYNIMDLSQELAIGIDIGGTGTKFGSVDRDVRSGENLSVQADRRAY